MFFSYQEWKETAPGFGMHVDVTDPRDKAVLSRAYGAQGRVREDPIYLKLTHKFSLLLHLITPASTKFVWPETLPTGLPLVDSEFILTYR